MAKRKIASKSEILEFYTNVMRNEESDGAKISDRLNAAEKLHRYYKEEKAKTEERAESGVVYLPEVKEGA